MKRKDYRMPTMKVVKLQQPTLLLNNGSPLGDLGDKKPPIPDTWGDDD